MNVTQLLARLSYGPLSNLSISNDGNGTIAAAKHPAIVDSLNEVLLDLYTRFDLFEKELIIEQIEGQTTYQLHSKYSIANPDADPLTVPFIADSVANPFTNDLVKILAVYLVNGILLPLNDDAHVDSVFTPRVDTLQVPNPLGGVPLYVIYQAKHPALSPTNLAGIIDVPAVMEKAVVSYVASRIYMHMNGQEHAAKAAEYMSLYEATCSDITKFDLVNSSASSVGTKFIQRGFA